MLILKNNSMNEKKYNSLIRYLCSRCDIISFLIPDYDYAVGINYEDRIKPLMEYIEPFVVKHYESDEYCDRKTGGSYNIYYVDFIGSLIGLICSAQSLYNWIYPDLPEDICFYKEGKCFLKSIAHEKLCWIYTENEKEVKALKKLGLKFTEMPFEQAPLL